MPNRFDIACPERESPGGFIRPRHGARNWASRTNYAALKIAQTGPTEMPVYRNQNYGQPTSHLHTYSMRLDGFASEKATKKMSRIRFHE